MTNSYDDNTLFQLIIQGKKNPWLYKTKIGDSNDYETFSNLVCNLQPDKFQLF